METLKSNKIKLNLRIESELKTKFMTLTILENKNATGVLTEFIQKDIEGKQKKID